MTDPMRNRSRLLTGCASAALALALTLAPQRAEAQGIQASGNVVFGAAEIDQSVANTTIVDVGTQTVVIDWTAFEDAGGNALTFLPSGTTALYQNGIGQGEFAVLNRILPSTNGNVVAINGSVISQLLDASGGATPGGFIAFYSPTGILVGSTASFDVGRLMLTTLDTDDSSFENFALSGFASFSGAPGSTARIQIAPGAQILATPENAFFAVVAADVEMLGTARVNGSHAYIAGEVVNLSFSNGLFNISVPVGTAASGEVVTVNGDVGGPSSTGIGDNHMIYGVARASADPISMMFSGNLGFDPAQSAGIVNGEIILSANFNVFGRFVNGDSISSGIAATFNQDSAQSDVRADIFIDDFTASSSLLAIGTHRVQATAFDVASSVAGNLLLVGEENAELVAENGQNFTITGDVLIDARDYGATSSSLQSLDALNARGGSALINAGVGSNVTITGSALVAADAFGGYDFGSGTAGSAIGGSALVNAAGGDITIGGGATITARGLATSFDVQVGAEARGGLAQLAASQGGSADITFGLSLLAQAVGADGSVSSSSSVSNTFGGQALLSVAGGGGTLTIGGDVEANAFARAGSSNSAGAGSIGDGGTAVATINGPGLITISGRLQLDASGIGGDNGGGTGGIGYGGRASATTISGGTIAIGGSVDDSFQADASGEGGDGITGGAGFGGIAGAIAQIGTITIAGLAQASADGTGGNASFEFGGNGGLGRGGNAFFQADGTLTRNATLSIGGDASVFAQGTGGEGGESDGSLIAAGRGGDGYGGDFSVPNQADPTFTSGAFLLAGGDRGNLTVVGNSLLVATGTGGTGGFGGQAINGGRGGDGFGGLAQTGLALLGQNGSVGLGRADIGDVTAFAGGNGGSGGGSGFDFPTGDGGNGTGGFAALSVRAGEVTAGQVFLDALSLGGEGQIGGNGSGGAAAVIGSLGGTLTMEQFTAVASGFGGSSAFAAGGLGRGGEAAIELQGISVTVDGDTLIEATGVGGSAETGFAGDGIGGTAYIAVTDATPGSGTFLGNTGIIANGFGGTPGDGGTGGTGRGGLAYAQAQSASTLRFGSLQVTASGRGGDIEDSSLEFVGGAGFGGTAELRSLGSGSNLIVERNFDSLQFNTALNGGGIVAALGIGGLTTGGTGTGGAGNGGAILLRAALGGSIDLPANPFNDPGSAGPNRFVSGAFGGDSAVDGGIGGSASNGNIEIEVEGGTITMGQAEFSVDIVGGDGIVSSHNTRGGQAIGGSVSIDVNGGSLSMDSAIIRAQALGGTGYGTSDGGGAAVNGITINVRGGGVVTAELDSIALGSGGDALGTGNGGIGIAGTNRIAVTGGTLNVVNRLGLQNSAFGGSGVEGGDALNTGEGGGTFFTADNATVAFTSSFGIPQLEILSLLQGGTGSAESGAALGGITRVAMTDTTLTGGPRLNVRSDARGGNVTGSGGVGGLARSDNISVDILRSDVSLSADNLIISLAVGGFGTSAVGGAAVSGPATVSLTGSDLNGGSGFSGTPGRLVIQSVASGGTGDTIGAATAAQAALLVNSSNIAVGEIEINSSSSTDFFPPAVGLVGGVAQSGVALLALGGDSTITTDVIELFASARTAGNGTARAGEAVLTIASGSTAVIEAGDILLRARGFGSADPSNNIAGRFDMRLDGGTINTDTFVAQALGNPSPVLGRSQLIAEGGSLLVSDTLNAESLGDIVVSTAQNGLIGNAAPTGNATAIQFDAGGSIEILGDNLSTGGLSGQTITMVAGRSILLDGNVAARGGAVTLTANAGGGPSQGQPPVSVITMGQGSRIDAGSGTVTIRLLDGDGNPQLVNGAITLASITAGLIDVRNLGASAGSDIGVLSDGVLTASGSGRAIDLASLNGEVINLHGDAGLILTGSGHYGIFAATPTGSQIGSFANYARRYNVADETAYDALNPGGNFAAFRIVPVLTVTADSVSQFYGNAGAGLTASFAGFQPGDSVADLLGAPLLTSQANSTSTPGLFEITAELGSLVSEQGYLFTFNPGELTVIPRPITVTANNLTRVYGNANPALTFTVGGAGLVNGDQLSGALMTTAGVTTGVGNVAITQGTVAASSNYALTFVNGQLTITPRPLTITADSFSRVYGNANPALTFVVSGAGLVNGDQLSGALATIADVTTDVGSYAITQGTLAASANYALTIVNGQLSITPRAITVTANNLSRIYGDANPALTFTVGGAGLVNGDQLDGALVTAAGLTTGVGTTSITQGTLNGGGNYAISFQGGQLTITARPITVTANDLTRIYGDANPALTFTVGGSGLVNGDQLSGALATTAGVTTGIGNVAITQGNLAASANYTLTFINGQLAITPRPITVTANNLTRIYGDANPALTFTVGGSGLVNGDQLGGALATAAGVTTGVGMAAITQGTLAASANYALSYVGGELSITPRPITITANNLTRIYGNANPTLTFSVGGSGLVNGDVLSGALASTAGLTTGVGTVAITQGTLAASANYTASFVGGQLTITPRPITITAVNLAKLLGQPDPAFTFTVGGEGLVNNDTLSGALTRDPGETIGAFAIRQGTLVAGPNYLTTFVEGALAITPPPAPPAINNPTVFEGPFIIVDTAPTAEDEEEEQFGMDFPAQPDALLIAEDSLLDEPVTSGGDASLYGSSTTPPTGGQ